MTDAKLVAWTFLRYFAGAFGVVLGLWFGYYVAWQIGEWVWDLTGVNPVSSLRYIFR